MFNIYNNDLHNSGRIHLLQTGEALGTVLPRLGVPWFAVYTVQQTG